MKVVKHRLLTTGLGAIVAGHRLTKAGYTKFEIKPSGDTNHPVAIELDAPEDETFDYLRPDILPPK